MKRQILLIMIIASVFTSCSKSSDGVKTQSQFRPMANAGADKVFTAPAFNVTLDGSGFDSDGSIVSYQWTQLSGPVTIPISNPGSASTKMDFPAFGLFVVALTVVDNDGLTDTDYVRIIVDNGECAGCWDY